jgi:hypothetical protein
LLYHSIFFLFHCVTLHPNHISNSDAIRNSHSVPAVGAGTNSSSFFPPYVHVVSLTISVHEGTTKLFPVFLKDCFTFHLFAFTVLFSSFSIALLCTPITSPYRITIRNSRSVPAVGAGNDSVRIFPAVCACSFFHDLGPWRDDQVLSCLRLFYFSPFCFCRSVFFLVHGVIFTILHPHHISISDAIRMSSLYLQAQQVGVG